MFSLFFHLMPVFYYSFFIWLGIASTQCCGGETAVAATIKPLHSLVSAVMTGVAEPFLLINGETSPHHHSLNVQQINNLRGMKIVFWIGAAYELPLIKIMNSLGKGVKVVSLIDKAGLTAFTVRQGILWGNSDSATGKKHNHGDHYHESLSTDGHIWLDPNNAKTLVKIIASELATLDPQHQAVYFSNSEKVIKRLEDLYTRMQTALKCIQGIPYIIYHDGMQYFDRHFKTNAVGALVSCTHLPVNARHLIELGNYIKNHDIKCVFTEPQYSQASVLKFIEQTGSKIVTLDYLGINISPGEDAYFLMMEQLAKTMKQGLEN
jgi:zinc transport system substrate-binding protein